MAERPTGTVAFLFSDIESSTRSWDTATEQMQRSVERHDEIVRRHVGAHRGYVFATTGDGFGRIGRISDTSARATLIS
jgi:class 3 adenylate cyclase